MIIFRVHLIILFLFLSIRGYSQERKEINFPNLPGYLTLKCDFHIHTVFSDGDVWPTIRVQEAWAEGLDAIAITDHIEYRPHSQDIPSDHNRSHEIALPLAEQLGIILIRGGEITRKMPPGHLNAIFVKNVNLLERESWFDACKEARDQGAFITWNHPGWKVQQPDRTLWWNDHTRLLEAGLLNGIEVVNDDSYYPEALRWANEKNLTILANSDIHGPTGTTFDLEKSHRPITLVFAKERSPQSIKEALMNRRTAAYHRDKLYGDRAFLAPLFLASVEIRSELPRLENMQVKYIGVHNNSDIDYKLKQRIPSIGFTASPLLTLKAHRTTVLEITGTSDEVKNVSNLKLYYEVENLIVAPGESLPVVLEIQNF
ncbi:MAG: hypothetical protein A2W90_13925 [Bacteroidetes bacterium GWF2_42_66]|nr:MAG: hypothetical protein A2W92_14640 [Bacteroidetes bacterium GWA2_42_15]OFX97349.1 MAG: hypothetical protein A2W89_01100 [Bacteroidetes bacterium GWE2_42_39]OFY39986.1 MAG: hypothetical protein A2W90_13925 [Bacteroidetes bacterium GWF2_42_66]HBL78180.1 histidinol-phosphatase [Prolixibacteraceae bacterium]HCR89462.1 histidinol-phosphatase [Prolixibacteraceae bacterium]